MSCIDKRCTSSVTLKKCLEKAKCIRITVLRIHHYFLPINLLTYLLTYYTILYYNTILYTNNTFYSTGGYPND